MKGYNDPIKQYKETQIKTASQGQLILMMYDGAIKFLNISLTGFEKKKYDIVNNNIIKAQDIITELMLALRLEAGEIAKNLYSLYEYMNRRLIEANIKKNPEICKEILKMLEELRDVWRQVIEKVGDTQPKEIPQPQYKSPTYSKP
ncbi:MAG TPA: flagellar export chaperone FliS, partial [bacterium]|nr:flagellar export chaperone FliS [bacterium]